MQSHKDTGEFPISMLAKVQWTFANWRNSMRYVGESTSWRKSYWRNSGIPKELRSNPDLASYSVIIIDEAHERTVHTDILFGFMKDVLHRRLELKLLITSTALEVVQISGFFHDTPISAIPGRRFPVEIHYTQASGTDYIRVTVEAVLQIHHAQPLDDTQVFLTGQDDVDRATKILSQRTQELVSDTKELIVVPIYLVLPFAMHTSEPSSTDASRLVLAIDIAISLILIFVNKKCIIHTVRWNQ